MTKSDFLHLKINRVGGLKFQAAHPYHYDFKVSFQSSPQRLQNRAILNISPQTGSLYFINGLVFEILFLLQ